MLQRNSVVAIGNFIRFQHRFAFSHQIISRFDCIAMCVVVVLVFVLFSTLSDEHTYRIVVELILSIERSISNGRKIRNEATLYLLQKGASNMIALSTRNLCRKKMFASNRLVLG